MEPIAKSFRLPEGWSEPEVVVDAVIADGLAMHRAGVACTGPAGEVLGSAADVTASPLDRAWFEVLERVSTAEAIRLAPSEIELWTVDRSRAGRRPRGEVFRESDAADRFRFARSSGVALYADWETACLRAFWELCERDRVLRAWYGQTAPVRLPGALERSPLVRAGSYEWHAISFPESVASAFSRNVAVCGVFGFPKVAAPLVLGFGARPTLEGAVDGAWREAAQILAFLWGEEIPDTDPPLSPTPAYHLAMFQRPVRQGLLRAWLDGAHVRYGRAAILPAGDDEPCFADLTPSWLDGLRVSKCVSAAAVPLVFGEAPFGAHLPPELRVHPIA